MLKKIIKSLKGIKKLSEKCFNHTMRDNKRMSPEKRLSERESLIELVQYIPYPLTSDKFLAGLIQNFNSTGLCMITSVPLEEGQEILLKCIVAPNPRTAVVCWCQQLDNSAFKIGLEFKQ